MSLLDFESLEPSELQSVLDRYGMKQEGAYRDSWERVRMLGYFCVSPWSRRVLSPSKLLPFSWDRSEQKDVKVLSRSAALSRASEFVHRLKSRESNILLRKIRN